ncbi:NAD-dependent epimerase/dehydratase family protein [Natranaerobius thermophilus]|uniref:NAD-dependent epimerase/dehydratase n=1 Tax=Natranaerobius thermophilus (strain ATCC BAA-1301 / DSM 18059 / JW/NM-WN-LF) TaxID=457570 RepID=B2A4I0_NATTJ|nr:NAD-dependent epimerase/dehydratase family protein [Natranaerobius thermophilus]ACB85157.1 NAD-dependent epimerase/dehydratase [Natranaerobius thermophilus JW/NM-WN-LF]
MKYLVTGAAGFIGSHLCKELVTRGNKVWGLDNLSQGKIERLQELEDHPDFQFIDSCISDDEVLEELINKVDIIYHMAAVVGVKRYVEKPERVIDVNVRFTSRLFELAYQLDKKVIFASTSEVYGKNNSIPFSEDDNRIYGPSTTDRWSYAISKSAAEHLCLGYVKKGLKAVIIRYFNVYGPYADTSAYGGVVTRFVNQLLTNKPMTVHNDGSQTRCFTYIDDIIKGTIEAGSRPEAEGKVFNLGHHRETSILELAETILKVSGINGDIVFQPYKEFYGNSYEDITRRVPDLSEARKILDYDPEITLEDGLKKTLNWYKDRV